MLYLYGMRLGFWKKLFIKLSFFAIFLGFPFNNTYSKDNLSFNLPSFTEEQIIERLAVIDQYNKGNLTLISRNFNLDTYHYPKDLSKPHDVLVYSRKHPQGCIVHIPKISQGYRKTLSYIPLNRNDGHSFILKKDCISSDCDKEKKTINKCDCVIIDCGNNQLVIPTHYISGADIKRYFKIASKEPKTIRINPGINHFEDSLDNLNKNFQDGGNESFLGPDDPDEL